MQRFVGASLTDRLAITHDRHRRRGRRRQALSGWRQRARSPRPARRSASSNATPAGHGHQHAQQRRDSRRHLLSAGLAEGAALRRRPRPHVRVLRRVTACPHVRSGKLIVAHDQRRGARARGASAARHGQWGRRPRNRRSRLHRRRVSRRSTRAFALWSPDSGIVNAEEFVKALLRAASDAGVMFLPGTQAARRRSACATAWCCAPNAKRSCARVVVNAAGLYADDVSQRSAARRSRFIRAAASTLSSRRPSDRCQRAGVSAAPPLGHGLGRPPGPDDRRTGVARADHPLSGSQRRLRERSPAARSLRRVGAAAARRRDRRRPAALRQRHPREAAPADRIVRGLPDPARSHQPGVVQASGIDSPGLTSSLAVGATPIPTASTAATATGYAFHAKHGARSNADSNATRASWIQYRPSGAGRITAAAATRHPHAVLASESSLADAAGWQRVDSARSTRYVGPSERSRTQLEPH